jgi:uncharacterized membrane protein
MAGEEVVSTVIVHEYTHDRYEYAHPRRLRQGYLDCERAWAAPKIPAPRVSRLLRLPRPLLALAYLAFVASCWQTGGWLLAVMALVVGASALTLLTLRSRGVLRPAVAEGGLARTGPRIFIVSAMSASVFAGIVIAALSSGDSRESAMIQAVVVTVAFLVGGFIWSRWRMS